MEEEQTRRTVDEFELPPAKKTKMESLNGSSSAPRTETRRGYAPVKAEYIISMDKPPNTNVDDDAAEASKHVETTGDARDGGGQRDSRGGKGKFKDKKERRGQNKGRKFGSWGDEISLCNSCVLADEFSPGKCSFGEKCNKEHNLRKYLTEGKILRPMETFGGNCPVFEVHGFCPSGWRCRFSSSHSKEIEHEDGRRELVLIDNRKDIDKSNRSFTNEDLGLYNVISLDDRLGLSRRKFDCVKSDKYLKWIETSYNNEVIWRNNNRPSKDAPVNQRGAQETILPEDPSDLEDDATVKEKTGDEEEGNPAEEKDEKLENRATYIEPPFRPSEKRRLYYGPDTPVLAPLTTQGNMPFRRLCVDLGAQVTFSEMAMGLPVIQGHRSEWALMRAHKSELVPPTINPDANILPGYDNSKDLKFGVQIAANKPWLAYKTAEVLAEYCPHMREINMNTGCPIDLVCNTGAGSALLDQHNKLEKMLRGMNVISGEIPITAKIRMGTKDRHPNADVVVNRLLLGGHDARDLGLGPCGVAAITLHGRSRQQRYSRSADWEYIADIAALIKRINADQSKTQDTSREVDERDKPNGGRVFFLGNGDCFSYEDYWTQIADTGVDGIMVARGAMIKPWIFEEIEARQHLDKTPTERLQYIEKFVRYGLDTWGSDETGIGTTRRFLLEWLSFLYRYVPIGLLERLPAKINERPPRFKGRDDMETLLASDNYTDWIKISEMFLGRSPAGFKFMPKHKSNSYELEAEG